LLVVSLTSASPAPGSFGYHNHKMVPFVYFGRHHSPSLGRYHYSPAFTPALRTIHQYNSSPYNANTLSSFARKSSSDDLVQQTKDLATTVTAVLEDLASNPVTAGRVNQIIKDNYSPCLTSLEDGISSLKASSQLVESLGPELQGLTDKFTSLQQLKDPARILRETGALLKQLQPLADKTEKIQSGNCPESFRSLALLVTEISDKPELRLKFGVRENLRKASATLSIVNVFLSKLKPTIARMKKFCSNDNKYNRDAMVAIGDLMLDLSNLYSSLGDIKMGEKFRYGKIYIERAVGQLQKLEEVGLGSTDCVNGDLSKAAEILDELATLIDEAGIETLQAQLGADLSFDFSFNPATNAVRRFRF